MSDLLSHVASIEIAIRAFGILLFSEAMFAKTSNFAEFNAIVARYFGIAPGLAKTIAVAVLALELGAVALLAVPATAAFAAILPIALLIAFAAAMGVALLRGERDLDCGCGYGRLRLRISPALIMRNLAMAAVFAPLPLVTGAAVNSLAILDGIGAGVALFFLFKIGDVMLSLNDAAAALRRRFK